ncbi:MAG TPA: xanthine dehydrogenase accessory protein XdhC [Chthoniobacterales bacterium]
MHSLTALLPQMTALDQAGEAFVGVTLITARGSVPQEVGAKMLVTAAGRAGGTIGGGRVEEAVIRHARGLLETAPPSPCETVEWNLQRDIGMTCGGVVTFLFESFRPSAWRIFVFGAGHVSQALARLLATLECRVRVVDSRPEWLNQLPQAANLQTQLAERPEEIVSEIPDGAFVVIMTQGHRTDLPILERILKTRTFPYLGVIGSASKAATLRKELREAGVAEDSLKAFRCPIGLPLGKDTPEEIAVSIAAELLQVRGT